MVRSILQTLARRTVPDLLAAIPATMAAVTDAGAIGYIGHNGYATT